MAEDEANLKFMCPLTLSFAMEDPVIFVEQIFERAMLQRYVENQDATARNICHPVHHTLVAHMVFQQALNSPVSVQMKLQAQEAETSYESRVERWDAFNHWRDEHSGASTTSLTLPAPAVAPPQEQRNILDQSRRPWGAVTHSLNNFIEQAPVAFAAILRQARDHPGGWDATLAHARRTQFFDEIHDSLFNFGGLLHAFTPVRSMCLMQLFHAVEQHTCNVILAQGSHSADPTGEAGETQPAFVRLFSQFFHECLTVTGQSAAVHASHQCTEHYVIGAQPPLGPGNQALRNEVSNSCVVGGQQVSNAIGDGIEIQEFEMQGQQQQVLRMQSLQEGAHHVKAVPALRGT